jgi:iron complex outermembrane recepter protein
MLNPTFSGAFLRLAGAFAGILAALPTPAQDAPVDNSITDQVTVTARRREESLQDVPVAVTAFSAERLAETGSLDITALQQTTPNLTLQVARGSNSTLIAFIRGVGQQDPLWGFEPGVGLYVDDVYVARPQGAVLDIYDIERIEVLRGPQGTLYGRNTVGGAVKYVTGRIEDTPTLDTRIDLGTDEQRDVILSGSLPLGETFAVGASAAIYRRDGYGDNLNTGAEHYNKDVNAYRATMEWTPSDTLFFRLSGDYLDDDSNPKHGHREVPGQGLAINEPVLDDVYDTRAGLGDDNNVETRGASFLAEWEINDEWTFKWITAWREGDTTGVIDFDMSPQPALDIPANYDDNQTTQELQFLYEGERIQAVAGLFYLDAYAAGAFDTIIGLANLTIATAGEVLTESFAAFTDVNFELTDQWSVSVGGRYTQDDKEGAVYRQNFAGIRSPLFGNSSAVPGLVRTNYRNDKTFSEFTPRASIQWEPTDALMLYTSYGRGFKSGGFDMRGDAFAYPATVEGYEPELVDTYELGVKTSLADGRVNFAGAVFYSDYTDMQITSQVALPTVPPTIVSFVDNAGAATIQGAELEGTLNVTDALSAVFQVGYTDAKFDEFVTFDPATGTRHNLADQRDFQNTPEWTGAVSFTYRIDLGDGGELSFIPTVSYRDEYQLFETAIPLLDQDAYTLVDASINWLSASGNFRLGVHGRNLTDEEYRVGGYNFPGALFGNSVNGFYGPPATYWLSANYRFD